MRSSFTLLAISLATALPAAATEPAALPLRPPCFSHAEVARQLKTTYHEAPVSLGLQSNGNLLQVFHASTSGSWTIVSTSPQGMACILAAGHDWQTLSLPDPDPAA
jgi:hypothetical protein